MLDHQFGGDWTEEKLSRIKKYLVAYTQIFKANIRASKLKTIYVDAFAGTGYRNPSKKNEIITLPLFNDNEAISIQKGSAQIALETEPPFDQYLFIDSSPEYFKELEKLRLKFNQKSDRITMVQKDANNFLQHWCKNINWRIHRAVIFLDPYGMEVEWKTIEIIAKTKSIDLWILFPLGQAVNRLLIKNRIPEGGWANRLTNIFGTDDWKKAFYKKSRQMNLVDIENPFEKKANFDSISKYFVNRLKTIFEKVATNPLPLCNSKNVPIFLLCFAASNPKGASTAVKIAQHILGK